MLRCGISSVFQKYIIRRYNPVMHNFNVVIADWSYMFRLLRNKHYQAIYQKYYKEIVYYLA